MLPSQNDAAALQPLLDNHLAFVATHRGSVHRRADSIEVVGEADFLSCWYPTAADAVVPAAVHTVRLLPWSGEGWAERLGSAGFEPAEVLLYMVAPLEQTAPSVDPDEVIEVANHADALAFADAQAGGFLEPEDDDQAWWREIFERKAMDNFAATDQSFYLLRAEGVPAAVSLVVRTNGVFGVYAVATRSEYRRRGYSTSLLARARLDAVERGAERLTLQVVQGSYAERLYREQGFTPAFASPTYRRSA